MDIISTAPRLNEKREVVYPADIKGLDTIVYALAATLHDAKDRTLSGLTAGKKVDIANDPEKVDLLTYARFNNEDVGEDAIKKPDVYTRKNTRPERKDQKNVRYNSLVRVATEERLKILGVYAR